MKESLLTLKGVGQKTLDQLALSGINNLYDLIEYLPRTYEEIPGEVFINEALINSKNLVLATFIKGYKTRVIRSGLSITKVKFESKGSIVYATFFNNPYIINNLKEEKEYLIYGKVEIIDGSFNLTNPICSEKGKNQKIKEGLNSIYPLSSKNKITNTQFCKFISQSLDIVEIKDFIPKDFKDENNLLSLKEAYRKIHLPKSEEDVKKGRERLFFDECASFAYTALKSKMLRQSKKTSPFVLSNKDAFKSLFPFSLTPSQEEVILDIDKDFLSGKVMNRLVLGDVGCGKTLIGMYGLYQCVKNGYQGAFLAPTKLLAMQHFENLKKIFKDFNIVLIHSKLTPKEKQEIYEDISSGKADIVIGTHSAFSEKVKYENLGLAVIDEQHRFGAKQRGLISKKGEVVHTLVMSATPIPRTLALSFYKDLEVSIVKAKPSGRREIKTYIRNSSYYDRIYNFVKENINRGFQCYIVVPSIEGEEILSVKEVYERLKRDYFLEYDIACIHGKMKEDEKEDIMEKFYLGKIPIIIATTVIEVGIDNKNATIMIIEDAHRFGMSTLHQLRGRVGRGSEESYCILISDTKSKTSIERLMAIKNNQDGFEISKEDLRLRGMGDILGYRQSGKDGFNIYKAMENMEIFNKASLLVESIMDDKNKENELYLNYLKEKYQYITGEITWN